MQVHKDGDEVRIYTRTGNDVTAAAPEIVSAVRMSARKTLILDGEAIALKPNGSALPVSGHDAAVRTRARRRRHARDHAACPVFFFDCLRRDEQ